jgi:uncharacterized protein (DUF427 family)
MKKATWNGAVIAQSDKTVVIEGNHYFPPESLMKEYFIETETHSTCPWKGVASYYNIEVNGEVNEDAAWFYKQPGDLAKEIKDHVAFWNGVEVQ